jgi:hypothetical protein
MPHRSREVVLVSASHRVDSLTEAPAEPRVSIRSRFPESRPVPPAIHALIIGVSAYPHLPGGSGTTAQRTCELGQLTAAASSAVSIYEWLSRAEPRLALDIGSCQLLLSPAPDEEMPDVPFAVATVANVRAAAQAWREACATDRESIALFYFAGHGVLRTRVDAALLCADFGKDSNALLGCAVDLQNLVDGMAPSDEHPDIARTQLWMVDACQGAPSELKGFDHLCAPDVWDLPTTRWPDDRCRPIVWAALPGTDAYSVCEESSIFSRALLQCLEGAAGAALGGSDDWGVTVGSLLENVVEVGQDIARELGAPQHPWIDGSYSRTDQLLVRLDGPPQVPVRLELRPAAGDVRLAVRRVDGAGVTVPAPLHPNPWADLWPASAYQLEAAPPACGIAGQTLYVFPPSFSWIGRVTP